MHSFLRLLCALFCLLVLSTYALPVANEDSPFVMNKRLSNEALIRLLMRNRNSAAGWEIKRNAAKRAEVERRSLDDDFSNCFLSPVQCMLPGSR